MAALQFAPAPLLAADVTWLGGSGNWSPATSWSTGALPTAADHVFVDGGQNGTASAVTVNVAASAGSLTLDAGDVINNTSGQVFSLFGPSFTNNGTFNNGNGAILVVRGTTALSGNGEIVLGTNTSSRIDIDGNHSLTIGAGNVVRGHSGTIGGQLFVAGTATLINDGLIVADGTDGTLILQESAVTNHGTLRATNGGTLRLDVGVSGGVIDANNGVVLQNGMRISDAVLTSANGGALRVSASSANFLDASTIGGQLDMTAGNARERVQNGLVLDGVVAIDNGGILSFEGNQTLGGSGTVEFGTAGAGNRLDLDGNGTTTIGENVTIRGRNGTIGQQINIAGTQTLVNHGVISADEAGGTITLTDSVVTNHGLLQAINGGTLVLSSNVTGAAGGAIDVGAGSVVLQNGVTLSGAINTSGDGLLRASSNSANFLDGVSLTGNLDLTLVNARERVKAGGLTLNGGIAIDNNASLSFEGNGSLDGNGTVVFGTAGAGNRLDLDGNGTTTIGENITIRGRNGTIGQNINIAGTQTLVNHG
ncbi:MAG: beta strand repeat-containing protein, partial [Gammaproteobacteria bacterium]